MNNKPKRLVGYLVYVVAFGSFVIMAEQLSRYLGDIFSTTYDPTYYWIFLSVYPILVGALLALPHFVKVLIQKGSWRIDWILRLAVGLPSLFVAINPIMWLAEFAQNWEIAGLIFGYPNLIFVAGVLFGHVLVSSLGKQTYN